ncbi:MAG: sulfatase-like hydrolase/transferase [Cyclobacteriaceae bacterium]
MPNPTKSIISSLLIALFCGVGLPGFSQSSPNPNIIFILADDLGYGDLQSYNPASLVPTPNLDRLAEEGTRLTNAYCPVAVCSPTRYSLMTGRYSFRSWKPNGVMSNYEPSLIEAELLTLPEMLRESGYTTAGFGKWHLGTTFPTLDGKKPAGKGQIRAEDNGTNQEFSKPMSEGPQEHGYDHR